MLKKEKISLNKKIYEEKTIEKARHDFRKICKTTMTETDTHFIIEISHLQKEDLKGEFANYLIGLKKEGT